MSRLRHFLAIAGAALTLLCGLPVAAQSISGGVPDPLQLSAGSASAPTYSFAGDPNTGIYNSASDQLAFATAGAQRWVITSAGHLLAGADAALDVGAPGANRPRNQYISGQYNGTTMVLGGNASIAGNIIGNPTTLIYPGGGARGAFSAPSDGVFSFSNNAGTNSFTLTASGSGGATFSGAVTATNSVFAGTTLKTGVTTVTGLGAAGNAGRRWMVNDSSVAFAGNAGATVAGGGSNTVPVTDNGTNWVIG